MSAFVTREQSDDLRAERAAFLAKWPSRDAISKSDAVALRALIGAALRNPAERALATTSLPRKAAGEIEDLALGAQRTARSAALQAVRDLYKSLLRHAFGPLSKGARGAIALGSSVYGRASERARPRRRNAS